MTKINTQIAYSKNKAQHKLHAKNNQCLEPNMANNIMTFDSLTANIIAIIVSFSFFVMTLIDQLYLMSFITLILGIVFLVTLYFLYIKDDSE